MSRKPAVRFAVVDPVTGRHSGVWKVWPHRNDVYVGARDQGHILKVSLHPGIYRVAYTAEHWQSGALPNNAPGPGRSIAQYEPSEIVDGVEYAWLLDFQPDALLDTGPLSDDIIRIEAPDGDQIVQVDIWICDPSVTQHPKRPLLDESIRLEDGRMLWVGYDTFVAEHGDDYTPGRRDYPAAILEFAGRSLPHVAPGLVLRPADIS